MPWVGLDDYMARTEYGLASFTIGGGFRQVRLRGGGVAAGRIIWFWFCGNWGGGK